MLSAYLLWHRCLHLSLHDQLSQQLPLLPSAVLAASFAALPYPKLHTATQPVRYNS